jgi:hypothetical protein
VTPEVAALHARLESFRAGVLKKLAGVSEDESRRSTVPSGTNLAGLLQHLTFVESKWFELKPAFGLRTMTVEASVSLRDLRADYKSACAASNAVIVSGKFDEKKLRRALLAVIGETAQHLGHADIIREQIDGQTGR